MSEEYRTFGKVVLVDRGIHTVSKEKMKFVLVAGACGGVKLADSGYIYYKNPQVEYKDHSTQFVNGTRSVTQGLIDLKRTNTIDLTNMSFDSSARPVFNGSSDNIQVNSSIFNRVDGQELTVECVMKPQRNGGQYQTILENRDYYAYNWMLYQHTSDGSIQLHGDSQYKSSYIPTLNQYVHIVATVTGGKLCTVYANGIIVQQFDYYYYHAQSPSTLAIGAFGTTIEPFLGSMPIVKIYNKALSQSEVIHNFNSVKSRFGIT